MRRHVVEKSGYLKSFPNLLGCVCALHGTEGEILRAADRYPLEDWTTALTPADLVLTPAACYPVYPLVAERGAVPAAGLQFDVACDCFRHEPSPRLDRLQSFRMREFVCIGSPEQVAEFRQRWTECGVDLAQALGLSCTVDVANDPFFGRAGQMVGVSQRQMALKFELQVPIYSVEQPTACMSFNYHQDHFGKIWRISDNAGVTAHTACVAFGMDRLAVAMFTAHGVEIADWPTSVVSFLGL
jgi:seryl-tRNA synthetase